MKNAKVPMRKKIIFFLTTFLTTFTIIAIGDSIWGMLERGDVMAFLYAVFVISLAITLYWNAVRNEEIEKEEKKARKYSRTISWED